ncbi:hypothetical protein DEO72_LG5g1754 [Vigna unguiculata]|uniref:Uncharacterized protein n=1 Tax=Vigna unguiculata TaxID=3917 RepID=A0A4D6LZA0_VIGUN|nr:hypothetical protein DEO72_LG5g1754 [Vigna unguiculata]
MWLVCDNLFGFARTSEPITKWGCSVQHERTFSKLVRMGAIIPALIQPGSIDHVPFPLVLVRLWLYERKPAIKKSLYLLVLDHIPSCASTEEQIAMHLAQLARHSCEWECSMGKVRRKVAAKEEVDLLRTDKPICAG